MKFFLAIILFFSTMISSIQENDNKGNLHYLVREPKIKSEKPPVIILLHGVGSNEEDLFSFADQLPDKYLIISARAPISLGGNKFAWYQVDFSTGKPVFNFEQEENSRNIIIKFIEELKIKYSINEKEIYLCGFSQGAIMSYSVALTRPDLVKGIAAMSGRLLEEIKPKIVKQTELKHLRIFISHGTQDGMLLIHYAKDANTFLKSLNITPIFNEYNEGHGINAEMLKDLKNWLK